MVEVKEPKSDEWYSYKSHILKCASSAKNYLDSSPEKRYMQNLVLCLNFFRCANFSFVLKIDTVDH